MTRANPRTEFLSAIFISSGRLLVIITVASILLPVLASAAESKSEVVSDAERFPNDWFYNPFNEQSAHHRPIGTGAVYADQKHPAVQDWLKGKQLNINVGNKPHGLYMVDADKDGPLLTVNPRAAAGSSGLPVTVRFPAGGVRIDFPDQFDGNIVIYDRALRVFHHLRQYAWNDGKPVAMQYRRYAPDIVGHGSKLGERIGTSASGVAAPFGILRGWEVKKEGHPIGHALQMVLPRLPENSTMMLSREVWWPAVSMDGSAYHEPSHNTGNIPYGSLWAIPPVSKGGPDLDKLGLSERGKRLAEAIRDYGLYVVDGGGAPSIRADQDFTEALRAELVEARRKIYPHVRMVLNSVPDQGKVKFRVGDRMTTPTGGPNKQILPGEFPAGGGTPLAPNTALPSRN